MRLIETQVIKLYQKDKILSFMEQTLTTGLKVKKILEDLKENLSTLS